MPMPASLLFVLAAATAPGVDSIEVCRKAHAQDAGARIACLENALLNQKAMPAPTLGTDQLEARKRAEAAPEEEAIRIVSTFYDARGRGVFRTPDGHVWRETEVIPEHLRLKPGREYSGRIERGVLGGYRLYVDGERGMLKVERLE